MEILQLNFPIYKFNCDESILTDVEKQFETLVWYKDQHNFNTDQFFHKALFDWFDDCIKQVQTQHMNTNFSLKIISCWVNKNTKLMKSPKHNHINSILSGVLYFSEENTSPLTFHLPDPYNFMQHQQALYLTDKDPYIKTSITPKRGMCVIFPSSIIHETLAHREQHVRYSIAFNTFASGTLTNNPTMKLNINLD